MAIKNPTHPGRACHAYRSASTAIIRPAATISPMPRTAIETGDVDFILPLDEIGPKLIELVGAARANEQKQCCSPVAKPVMLKRRI